MARLGLLFIATLALVLVTSAAPCHDKGQDIIDDPLDGLDNLDNDIGNFESDDDLGESDDEYDSDDFAGDFDPSELGGEPPFGDDNGVDFGEDDFPEDDIFGPDDGYDNFGPDDGYDNFGPEDDFGLDEFDPDCPEGIDGPYEDEGNGRKGSLINIEAGHIGTGDIHASNIGDDALGLGGLELTRNLEDLTVG